MSNKIKVLYVVPSLKNTGPTNQLLGIVKNINHDFFHIKILTLSNNPSNSRKNDFDQLGVQIDTLSLGKLATLLVGEKKLSNYVDEFGPDVIHTSGFRADSIVNKSRYKDKQILTIRNFAREDYVDKFGPFLGKYLAFNTEKIMKKSVGVIYCSNSIKKMYSDVGVINGKVIQNGVDTERFKPVKNVAEKELLRKKLNLPTDKTIFLSVGSLIERKNPMEIIESFSTIDDIDSRAILIFLGDGNLMKECNKYQSEYIFMKGNVDNVDEYMKASDVFISSSKSEGLPNTVLEASALGLDLILTDIPQHKEILEEVYIENIFYTSGMNDDLSKLITFKLKDKIPSPNLFLASHIKEKFSMKIMSLRYQDLYRDKVGGFINGNGY